MDEFARTSEDGNSDGSGVENAAVAMLTGVLPEAARRLHSTLLELPMFVRQIELEVERALPGRTCRLVIEIDGRGHRELTATETGPRRNKIEDLDLPRGRARSQYETAAILRAGRVLGRLAISAPSAPALSDVERAHLHDFADHLGPLLNVAVRYATALRDADSDGLTGLANHRAFYRVLHEELDRRAGSSTISVVLFDIDGLKQVNDQEGHLAGDALLRQFARMLEAQVRRHDFAARYGGDEFAVVMPQTAAEHAALIASRVRRALRKRSLTSRQLRTTAVSFGVATAPRDGTDAPELVAVADRRLYASKRQRLDEGRDSATLLD